MILLDRALWGMLAPLLPDLGPAPHAKDNVECAAQGNAAA